MGKAQSNPAKFASGIWFDKRLESYQTFFRDDFGHKADSIATANTRITQPVLQLVYDWRATSYAAALPSLLPGAVSDSLDGYIRGGYDPERTSQRIDMLVVALADRVPAVARGKKLRLRLQKELTDIARKLRENDESLPPVLSTEAVWENYLTLHPFVMGLHRTMELSFVAIYVAFENFVTSMISAALNGQPVTVRDQKEFKRQFRQAFGEPTIQRCWFARQITDAREIRNSISHAGGRVTTKLENYEGSVLIKGNRLQIFPGDLKDLYETLRDAAVQLMTSECWETSANE
ncbi:hypothetical protein [Rhodopirellula bahusiensis]|uniref:Uncharacterized protein n=1 Tax=Rhodopirellula bahusiensis TaxID=2014065 RepID=A0A2G1W5Q1_9BACT|nr:hypothetical protein [Rhodopirellula bahusiensis]PHQ34358.1 hypothetical protein CEE69_15180 [Rhodopirellula bahusiensis]